MRADQIVKIQQSAEDLNSSTTNLLTYFNEEAGDGATNFDASRLLHGSDVTFIDCVSRIQAIAGIAKKFDESSNHLMVPGARLIALQQGLERTQNALDALANQFRQSVKNGGGAHGFNYDNYHLQTVNGTNIDLRGQFKSFADSTEQLLEAFYQVLVILRPTKTAYRFQAVVDGLSELVDAGTKKIQELNANNGKALKALQEVEASRTRLEAEAKEVSRLKGETEADRKTISEYLAETTSNKSNIDAIHSAATKLKDQIKEYQEKFDSFDRQLDDRLGDLKNGKLGQQALFQKFEDHELEVERLVKQSNSMLKGATVAGLASSFQEAHKTLGWQLFWARISFYFGIVFLFFCALPLLFYIFLPVLGPVLQNLFPELNGIADSFNDPRDVSGWQYLGQVLARFVILLPAAWFVSFSAIRHSSLFRLREHYAYKYSMAVSVEGFQKQAEGYEGEVAALVLEQLAFNPADKLVHSRDIQEGKVPHPILSLILAKLRKRMGEQET